MSTHLEKSFLTVITVINPLIGTERFLEGTMVTNHNMDLIYYDKN